MNPIRPVPMPAPPMRPIQTQPKTDPGNLTQVAQKLRADLHQDAKTHLGRMFSR